MADAASLLRGDAVRPAPTTIGYALDPESCRSYPLLAEQLSGRAIALPLHLAFGPGEDRNWE